MYYNYVAKGNNSTNRGTKSEAKKNQKKPLFQKHDDQKKKIQQQNHQKWI